jgi:(1->4)-alpha-D-glucan 1-alpha-D-glucosylmutase
MSATVSNAWWADVLENGRESRYAEFFDIDWNPADPTLRDKVLLPMLGDHYGKVLESGSLRLVFEGGKFFIDCYGSKFPVNRAALASHENENPERVLQELNGTRGDARSFDRLDAVIRRQHYRFAYWRVAAEEINFRRFFDVSEMVALKMELPEVFRETHAMIFEWLEQGRISGLRIDHPDGLWNPKQYFERLQKENPVYVVAEKILCGDERPPQDWPADGTTGYDFLNRVNGLFVDGRNAAAFDNMYREFTGRTWDFERIVHDSREQVLKTAFPSELNSLARKLKHLAESTRGGRDFTLAELRTALAEFISGFSVYRTYITEDSTTVSEQDRKAIEAAKRRARMWGGGISDAAFEFIARLLLLETAGMWDEAGAKKAREFVMKFQQLTGPAMAKGLEDTAFYRFNRLLSLNEVGGDPGKFGVSLEEFHAANNVMAKAWPHTLLATATHDTKRGEDLRARLNVLSEMPMEWQRNVMRWPQMIRGKNWTEEHAPCGLANEEYLIYQTLVGAWPGDLNDLKTREAFHKRVSAFLVKAGREAKVETSWTMPDSGFENSIQHILGFALRDVPKDLFLEEYQSFAERVAFFGRFNSLAQTLLKITSPGVPDVYQGSELWDLNLVDPDNRRAVDYDLRRQMLAELKAGFEGVTDGNGEFFSRLLRDEQPGAIKLFLIWRALKFRAAQRELFDCGEYLALFATGAQKEHVCAFARKWKERTVIVVVPRLVFGLTRGVEVPPIGSEIWKDTMLPMSETRAGDLFRNVLTREMVPAIERYGAAAIELSAALKSFPVALLEKV